ncbi:MAG TPA: tetratricopeptide repeat protein [Alcanivorax sp.]|nr:tetratricopeptide repeat protein [Alcanivorax sp.]
MPVWRGRRAILSLGGAGLFILLLVAGWRLVPSPDAVAPDSGGLADAGFVGSETCGGCHQAQYQDWLGSHHQRAMQEATDATVLGDFDDVRLDHGDAAVFSRDGDTFSIRVAGPDGEPRDYPVRYTFGVEPLQQYLIPLPGGRLQAFTSAWDSRPREQGGQRWFALYPEGEGRATDPLHWTGLDQNWNSACAHCHSTGLRKGYDPLSDTYQTTYAEISVGCEACHGPGADHLVWAKAPGQFPERDAHHGLKLDFGDDARGHWRYDPTVGEVIGQGPAAGHLEVETCGRCHALGARIHEDVAHGQPVGDDIRVALLDPALYYPDGQIKGEVFEYGSFLQSRMFHAGVTCGNCHDPHSARLRAEGNGLCTQCHQADQYDSSSHFNHPVGSPGAQCVNCHMPERTYMKIDGRRDHSLRVPRPDLSVSLGTPNACNQCHQDQSAGWAARHIKRWSGDGDPGLQRYGHALAGDQTGTPEVDPALFDLVADPTQPAIARATALTRLGERGAGDAALFQRAASDASPLVRRAAALHPGAARTLLDDPVRSVRISAAETLASSRNVLPPAQAKALDRTLDEYRQALALNADRPEAHVSLARLHASQGDPEAARRALEEALRLDPAFVPAAVNLADFHRAEKQDHRAAEVLRQALRHAPEAPALHYALGLLLIRQGETRAALDELAAATRLAPGNAHYAYVYELALKEREAMTR